MATDPNRTYALTFDDKELEVIEQALRFEGSRGPDHLDVMDFSTQRIEMMRLASRISQYLEGNNAERLIRERNADGRHPIG